MILTVRKKPVIVQAMKYTGDNISNLGAWSCGAVEYPDDALIVRTLEGTMIAEIGDYIIKGIKGEFYPCKPDIFEATYEIVTEV